MVSLVGYLEFLVILDNPFNCFLSYYSLEKEVSKRPKYRKLLVSSSQDCYLQRQSNDLYLIVCRAGA